MISSRNSAETNAQLQNDNAWLKTEVSQYQGIVTPPIAAEEIRECREIPMTFYLGQPAYGRWAQVMARKIAAAATAEELKWLREDNRHHIAAYETAIPGGGRGVEQRISERLIEVQHGRRIDNHSRRE
jgi:hypothetical protein